MSLVILISGTVHPACADVAEQKEIKSLVRIEVKFRPGTPVESAEQRLPPALRTHILTMKPLVSLKDEQLERIGARQMSRWFVITLRTGTDVEHFITDLKNLDEVETAEIAPEPAPPP